MDYIGWGVSGELPGERTIPDASRWLYWEKAPVDLSITTNNYSKELFTYGVYCRSVRATATAPLLVHSEAVMTLTGKSSTGSWTLSSYDSGYTGEPVPRVLARVAVPSVGGTVASTLKVHVLSRFALRPSGESWEYKGVTRYEYEWSTGQRGSDYTVTTGTVSPGWSPTVSVAGLVQKLSTSATSATWTGSVTAKGRDGIATDPAVVEDFFAQDVRATLKGDFDGSLDATSLAGQVPEMPGFAAGGAGGIAQWLSAAFSGIGDALRNLMGAWLW